MLLSAFAASSVISVAANCPRIAGVDSAIRTIISRSLERMRAKAPKTIDMSWAHEAFFRTTHQPAVLLTEINWGCIWWLHAGSNHHCSGRKCFPEVDALAIFFGSTLVCKKDWQHPSKNQVKREWNCKSFCTSLWTKHHRKSNRVVELFASQPSHSFT